MGGCNNVHYNVHVCCLTCDATLMLRSCLGGVGWGGVGHTGAIDSVWRLVKQQVPGSLSSTVKGSKANPRLMVYARKWQWRVVQKNTTFLRQQAQDCLLTSSNEHRERKKKLHLTSCNIKMCKRDHLKTW